MYAYTECRAYALHTRHIKALKTMPRALFDALLRNIILYNHLRTTLHRCYSIDDFIYKITGQIYTTKVLLHINLLAYFTLLLHF